MKKFIMTAITAAIMLTVPAIAAEGDSITVYSNGNLVADKGIIVEGRTLVPVRGVFEYMGYEVEWDNDTKTATLTNEKKETVITLTNGKETFTVNDTIITPEVPQQIIDGKFMLPLRAIGEAVNAKVDWNNDTKTATINENNNFFDINSVDEDDPIIDEMPINEIYTEEGLKEKVERDAQFEELREQAQQAQSESTTTNDNSKN